MATSEEQLSDQAAEKPKGRGGKRVGAGRPPGSANKITREVRESLKSIVEGNMDKLKSYISKRLDSENAKEAHAAATLLTRLLEFAAPKMNRADASAPPGEDAARLAALGGFQISFEDGAPGLGEGSTRTTEPAANAPPRALPPPASEQIRSVAICPPATVPVRAAVPELPQEPAAEPAETVAPAGPLEGEFLPAEQSPTIALRPGRHVVDGVAVDVPRDEGGRDVTLWPISPGRHVVDGRQVIVQRVDIGYRA